MFHIKLFQRLERDTLAMSCQDLQGSFFLSRFFKDIHREKTPSNIHTFSKRWSFFFKGVFSLRVSMKQWTLVEFWESMSYVKSFQFNAAVQGFHYYRSSWVPEPELRLNCSHIIGNTFDVFVIKVCGKENDLYQWKFLKWQIFVG